MIDERQRLAWPDAARHSLGDRSARLDISVRRDADGVSFVARQFAGYPFHLCRPFRYAGDPPGMATLYLQSCSGGIFAGDRLAATVQVGEGAALHLTSQAATIVHGMERGWARQEVSIEAAAGSFLEFLPDPLILFPRARLTTRLQLRLHADATAILGDAFLPHDPAGGGATFDCLDSETIIADWAGTPLAGDRFELAGNGFAAPLPGVGGGFGAHGMLLVLRRGHPADALIAESRAALATVGGIYAGATTLPGEAGALVRLLAADGVALRAGLHAAWAAARRHLVGTAPARRRK